MPVTVQLDCVSKAFGPIRALDDVSFKAESGRIHAICGENGAGKSTLLNILTGVIQPDQGSITIGGVARAIKDPADAQIAGIGLVSQELSIAPHLTVYDNIWLGYHSTPIFHKRSSLKEKAKDVLEMVGLTSVPLSEKASKLSIGEQQLLEIARMLVRDVDILLLDEPTATLSDHEIERVFSTLINLKEQQKTIIFITHRLGEVMELCDQVTVLRNGQNVWSSQVKSSNRHTLINHMLGRPLEEMYPETSHPEGIEGIAIADLTVPSRVSNVSFTVDKGRIACIAGQIGSGAFDALRALAGLCYDATGSFRIEGVPASFSSTDKALRQNVRFVSEDRASEGLFLRLSATDNLIATQLPKVCVNGFISGKRVRQLSFKLAELVVLNKSRLDSYCHELSGGNQQKVAIGRSILSSGSGVLIMNEPTRGVDVGARADIYKTMRQLCDVGYTILMASTDIEEIVGLSDVIITMYRGKKINQYQKGEFSRDQILSDITHPTGLN